MSWPDRKQAEDPQARSDKLPAKYEVGYGKPPAEHRFRKGASGNPRGRPKGAKNKVPTTTSLEFGAHPANQILLQEAYRSVTVREGDQVIQLPAIQAVFRAMSVSAMKGNRFSQRTLAELVQQIENEDRETRSKHIEALMDYKAGWERNFEWAREQGIAKPEPIPHPDDIIVDLRSPDAFINGPMTKEEKARWDERLQHRQDTQEEVSYYARQYKRAKDVKKKELRLEWWKGSRRSSTSSMTIFRRDTAPSYKIAAGIKMPPGPAIRSPSPGPVKGDKPRAGRAFRSGVESCKYEVR